MKDESIYTKIRTKISQDKIGEALKFLNELLEFSPKLDEAILQTGRYNALQKQVRLGTLSQENSSIQFNQIRADLLHLLNEMEHGATSSKIQQQANQPSLIQYAEKIYNIEYIEKANFS